MKEQLIENINTIAAEANSHNNGYHYNVKINDWANYGKNRTYFSIVETRDCSKHCKEKKYGFIDNLTGEYFPEKYADLTSGFDFGGNNRIF